MHWLKYAPSYSRLSRSAYDGARFRRGFASNVRIVVNDPDSTTRFALPLAFLTTDTTRSNGETTETPREERMSASWPHNWVHRFNQQGYSTVTIYLPSQISNETPIDTHHLSKLERDLQIQLSGQATSFFPPLLFSKGRLECLLAQTYVSSNPLSGLVLISPPTEDSASFDFEPRFPTLIMSTASQTSQSLAPDHRLLKDYPDEVDHLEIVGGDSNMTDQTAFEKVKEWMDNNGL
ncbi:uncharacterized protein MELLADRAFT_102117 [Melampsora larici-populina 98AG31]|uniref:Uncharacterized protein n=1 Tax=Melampsora larici-populina (strain 98AG31 / pathotype 3-4-7) TaxID=747676 RepID=F4R624_MELLP|nr:uncharacterized protein MELLADRAFT_102117 [Melampsora larici-populina 98AG31]EGG12158.1 hypothetical protein MELLADRAFT_102117 [Melampsora larici-populina 98AG31]